MKNKAIWIIIGAVLTIVGGITGYIGYGMYSDIDSQVVHALSTGAMDDKGMVILIVGAVIMCVGVLILRTAILKKKK